MQGCHFEITIFVEEEENEEENGDAEIIACVWNVKTKMKVLYDRYSFPIKKRISQRCNLLVQKVNYITNLDNYFDNINILFPIKCLDAFILYK